MTLLAISSLTPENKLNELNVDDQKLVKGGFFNNETILDRDTTVSSGTDGSIVANVSPGGYFISNSITQTGAGFAQNNINFN